MTHRYIAILLLAAGLIMLRAAAGFASDHGFAKTTARVNLRQSPSLSGKILATIPTGQQVKILQASGAWWKVDASGEFSASGWIYARYLETIRPETPKKEYAAQIDRAIDLPAAQKVESHPAGLSQVFVKESAELKSGKVNLSAEQLASALQEQAAASGVRPPPEKEPGGGPRFVVPADVESAGGLSANLRYYRFRHEAPEKTGEGNFAQTEPQNARLRMKPAAETGPSLETARNASPAIFVRAAPAPRIMASADDKSNHSEASRMPAVRPTALKPIAMSLKIISVLLYGIVILLLYKGD